MHIPLIQVDAFTDKPFSGNPAAVCLLDKECDADWMQAVAAEMNLSETAFVRPLNEGFELRWFTPKIEVDLCGHATLAAAHALWTESVVSGDEPISFNTRSGVLTCTSHSGLIELAFPSIPIDEAMPLEGVSDALGCEAVFAAKSKFDILVQVDSEKQVLSLAPSMERIRQLPARGVIVTSRSDDPQYDFVSRFFAPSSGIEEDPVCGSAHCVLGPFWGQRLDKSELTGYQASPRGGVVRVRLAEERVFLAGKAVTTIRGQLLV